MMKLLRYRFSGIVIAVLYAFFARLAFSGVIQGGGLFGLNLFSITFIWVVPIFIGWIPIIFSNPDKIITVWSSAWTPAVSVLVFFIIAFLSGNENIICLIIIALPFITGAVIGGEIIRFFIMRKRRKNGRMLYSLLLLIPLLSSVIESRFPTPSEKHTFTNTTIINATPEAIWPQIIRVKEINENEYHKGLFYYSGVPRPLDATLDKDTTGGTRIGHFQGGLKFIEKVSVWEKNKKILFDITVDTASIGDNVFNRHMLKGGHFHFIDACYELKPLGDNRTQLSLTSSYELDTKINGYATYWPALMLPSAAHLHNDLKKKPGILPPCQTC